MAVTEVDETQDTRHGMKPFFSYYGGKYRAAPRYPEPLHGRIIEPFAGSAGYALRYPDLQVTLVDANPKIAAIWRYLIGTKASEIQLLPIIGPDECLDDYPEIPEEAGFLIGFWLNRGSARPERRPSAWHRKFQATGERPLSRWSPEARNRVASQVAQIAHWRIIEGDYTAAPIVKGTWFVDPPYANKAGKRYPTHRVDYTRLGAYCRGLKGRVTVCEQEGATWLPFRSFLTMKATEGAKRKPSKEVIWTRDTE